MTGSAERTAAKQARRVERERELAARIAALPTEQFGVAYVDPPWRYETWSEKGKDRAADNHYPTMTDAEIIAMADRIKALTAENSVLFLWATVPKLMVAGAVMQAWGFTYKSSFAWDKDKFAHGHWNRNHHEVLTLGARGELDVPPELLWLFETRDGIEIMHEYMLIGVRGKDLPAPAPGTQYPSLIRERATRHSAKPEMFYKIIESYFPNLPKIELFARGPARPGWTVWGQEAVSAVHPLVVPEKPRLVVSAGPDYSAVYPTVKARTTRAATRVVGNYPAAIPPPVIIEKAIPMNSTNLNDDEQHPPASKPNGPPPSPDPETKTAASTNGGGAPPFHDPFDPSALRIDSTSDASLGVERPILVVPVKRPDKQTYFRVHPDPAMRVDVRIIELEAERETYLVAPAIAAIMPGETRPVRLLTCIPRVGGGVFLWPLKLPNDSRRETGWGTSARKGAELGKTKWVRLQANLSMGAYDVTTSAHIPEPVWPVVTLSELLRLAFSDGRLIDRDDHPVIRQLLGTA